MNRTITLLFLFFIPFGICAQIFPKEGSKLNYRLIGFSFPEAKDAGSCTVEISPGTYNNDASFKESMIQSVACKGDKVIAVVPYWGNDYTWRTVYSGRRTVKSKLHHFSTMMSDGVDTARMRLRIIKNAEQYKDAYVFVDESHALYDMNGNPVWFLPDIDPKMSANSPLRDIKLTPQGTITFMIHLADDDDAYEIGYNGAVIWKGPDNGTVSGNATERYHHEFTRLSNGHYMVLGNQSVFWELPDYHETNAQISKHYKITRDSNSHTYRQKMDFGTIMEYDEKGVPVWSWKAADYYKNSDVANKKREDGVYDIVDNHENSFFFDERDSILYISCRNISRILKLKYPEGRVLAAYGNKYTPEVVEMGNQMFCGQHSVKRSTDGYLYLFNNNSLKGENFAKVELLAEPVSEKDTLKKIWEYTCTTDGMNDAEKNAYYRHYAQMSITSPRALKNNAIVTSSTGGNVVELPGGPMFVSTCGPVSKMFIVNKDKEVLWSAILEARSPENNNWAGKTIYRASIIADHKDLERLIFKY